jgi:hypothetical protein
MAQKIKVIDGIRALFIIGAVIVGIVLLIGHLISGGGATWTAKVDGYKVISPADLQVTIQVTNTGSKAGTATCTVTASASSSAYAGSSKGTLSGTVAPGQAATAAVNITITNRGARYITDTSVRC